MHCNGSAVGVQKRKLSKSNCETRETGEKRERRYTQITKSPLIPDFPSRPPSCLARQSP